MGNKRVYIEGNGCPVNMVESALLESFFRNNGYIIAKTYKNADIVTYNSCACCKFHEDEAFKKIKKIQAELHKDSKFIVWGCLPKINNNRLEKVFRGVSFGPELYRFNNLIQHEKSVEQVRPKFSKKSLYRINIANGCLGQCTFCAVRNARGLLKSRSVEDITNEIKEALQNNYTKISLEASDIGCYGKDIKTDLIALLEKIDEIGLNFKVKLGAVCINNLKSMLPQFIAIFKKKRFIKYLQLDIESGSDKILGLMNRQYSIEDVRYCIKNLTAEVPSIKIISNFIVGFPGETNEDFNQSMRVIKELNIFPLVLKFNKRPFTKAKDMPSQIPSFTILRRYRKMNFLAQKICFLISPYFKIRKRQEKLLLNG